MLSRDREQLERKLLEQVRAAEKAYRAAAAEHERLKAALSNPLDDPDRFDAVREAAFRQERALENYLEVFGRFTDLVVNGKPPGSSGAGHA